MVNLLERPMNRTVQIPDDLAERLTAAGGALSRRALEAFALEEYKIGKPELRQLLDDLQQERRDLSRLGL